MIVSDEDLHILMAYWGKVMSEKAGEPIELLKIADRIGEYAAELKRRQARS